jgi:hypothetical protein
MTQRPTLLRIAEPCHESWAAMTPAGPGRHCAACQKTVVDFSQKTDAEILAALRQAAGPTCGRLRPDQLGRPLVAPTTAPRWRAWLGAALAVGGVLGASRAAAQSQGNSYYAGPRPLTNSTGSGATAEPTVQAPPAVAAPDAIGGPLTVRGVVLDSTTHTGLPGVTVLVKGTDRGVSTDATGAFELAVPAGTAPTQLIFSSIGFMRQEKTVVPGQPLTVALAADTHVLGGISMGIVVTSVAWQKPWPWHPRHFLNWSKRLVTKPFRD